MTVLAPLLALLDHHTIVLIVLCISRLTIFDRQITFASGNLWRVLPPLSIVIARFCPYFVFFDSSLPFYMSLNLPRNVANVQRFRSRFYGSCLGWL
jgi:hypothetical protein